MRGSSLFIAFAVVATTGCNRPHHIDNAFTWSDSLPPGATLHVRDGMGDITVQHANGPRATVTASKQWNRGRERDISFTTRRVGNDLYICAMWRSSGNCGEHGYRGARASGGILAVFSLFRHRSDASSDFIVQVPADVRVDAVTSLGDITVEGTRAGVSARTAVGDVRAAEVAGNLSLSTTNGDVQATVASIQGVDSVSLRTTNGDVHATIPSDLSGHLELSTANGDLRSDFPVPATRGYGRRTVDATLGGGPTTVRLRTTNGDVVVTKRP